MYAVLVADTDIDNEGWSEPEIIGPFETELEAEKWAMREMRYLVMVIPITMRGTSTP